MDNSTYGQKSTLGATDSALHINIEDQIVKYPDFQFPLLKDGVRQYLQNLLNLTNMSGLSVKCAQ